MRRVEAPLNHLGPGKSHLEVDRSSNRHSIAQCIVTIDFNQTRRDVLW